MNKHPWDVSIQDACIIQEQLKNKVIRKNSFDEVHSIGGVDVAYDTQTGKACCVVTVLSFPGLEMCTFSQAKQQVGFAYISGLLAFREGPLIEQAFESLNTAPDILIFDGHGICHPKHIGIASHMGIYLDIPTIGCAKTPLYRTYTPVGTMRGDRSDICASGEVIGCGADGHGSRPERRHCDTSRLRVMVIS